MPLRLPIHEEEKGRKRKRRKRRRKKERGKKKEKMRNKYIANICPVATLVMDGWTDQPIDYCMNVWRILKPATA